MALSLVTDPLSQQQTQIKPILRQQIQAALQEIQALPAKQARQTLRNRLALLKNWCNRVGKTFIVVEETISCNRHCLGGRGNDRATLFRGPNEDASVAICITDRGSILHRNGSHWRIYRDAGDIHPD